MKWVMAGSYSLAFDFILKKITFWIEIKDQADSRACMLVFLE
jgi:hypothetical protein